LLIQAPIPIPKGKSTKSRVASLGKRCADESRTLKWVDKFNLHPEEKKEQKKEKYQSRKKKKSTKINPKGVRPNAI